MFCQYVNFSARSTNRLLTYYELFGDILPPPNGYATLVGASCDLRRELSTPFAAAALALTSIATEGLFTQSPCPGKLRLIVTVFYPNFK